MTTDDGRESSVGKMEGWREVVARSNGSGIAPSFLPMRDPDPLDRRVGTPTVLA